MRYFDLIAFDWDGTLFDSTALITRCIQAAVVDVGGAMPSAKQASYVIGLGLIEALAHAAPDVPKEKYPELGARYRHHYLSKQAEVAFFEGSVALLQALRCRGHKTAVATGKSRRGLDDALLRQVDGVGLASLFDASRTADQTAGKPSPDMLFELMQELDVTPERTLMIGDTTHDLQMAINAGCAAVGVSYGAHDAESLETCHPLLIAHSVAELSTWLSLNA